MKRVLLDQAIHTDYGQLDLIWTEAGGFDGDFDRFFAGQVNGLVGAADPDGVYVNLARRSGGSSVRIVLLDEAPAEDDVSWEDVVEVSFLLPAGHTLGWIAWAGLSRGSLDGVPSGSFRLRVSARGRDEGSVGEDAEDLVDFYLLELWLAPPQPDAVLRTGSWDSRYWHSEWGQRR
ncbi:hypothetical protein [Arthrobacter sp. NicSoilB4]|uniref:hypothetical protein n=1 Tax=Arthrobacter sp. NicSoilB4 TaxID=2830997 RepID=UPI001CC6EB4E|nr:hypothetical protein [Arthrobacter sp. NicSoilB4]